MLTVMQIEILSQRFDLLAGKAVYWPAARTLLLADLHLGKITHFRKEGIALPVQAVDGNFSRLDTLLRAVSVKRIIFLGDFFHHMYNREWEKFVAWRSRRQHLELLLVKGNHDRLENSLFFSAGVEVHEHVYKEAGFCFCHHPGEPEADGAFRFAGHVHPVFRLTGKGRSSMRLPCFSWDPHELILPSFGEFTGGHAVPMRQYRRIFVVAATDVLEVPQ